MSMKSAIMFAAAAIAVVALAAPFATVAQGTPDGAAVFESRCKFCHEGGGGPPKSQLATHTADQIVDILTNGVMQPMAAGLSDPEKKAVAAYLTASAAPAPATNAPAAPATNAPSTNAPATNAPAPATP
jgi:polyvinyl alcohol dehydrogenase (cytochrome)